RWRGWFTPDREPVPAGTADFDDPDWCDRHRWRWHPARAEALLDDPEGPRFWCGFSSNLEDFADRFEAVLSLWVDGETMMTRILSRSAPTHGARIRRCGTSCCATGSRSTPAWMPLVRCGSTPPGRSMTWSMRCWSLLS